MNRVITTMVSGEKPYCDFIKVFLLSLRKTSGTSTAVIIYVVNGPHVKGLERIYPGVMVHHQTVENPTPIRILYTRPQQMMDCLNEGYDQIASIDADIIFRKDIFELWDGAVQDSVKYWNKGITLPLDGKWKNEKDKARYLKKKSERLNTVFQGGVFVIGNGEVARKYWSGVVSNIPSVPDGYCSQRLMYLETLKHKELKFVPLSPAYNDCYFNDESIMWHGKSGHRDNSKLQKIFQEYLSEANTILGGVWE